MLLQMRAQKNMDLQGFLPFQYGINDIWGYTDTSGREYALVGSEVSLLIVEVSNPQNPVLLFEIFGDTSQWRDIKTFDHFAYVCNEENGGLLIVDLRNLPNNINHQYVSAIDTFDYQTAHNIFIDENGVAYLLGSNISNQGAFIIDVNTSNRFAPEYLGLYDDQYVHDAFVRGDTLYTAEISNGTFSVVDISDKSQALVLARQTTSRAFTHNCWLSDDGNYLATTDEKPGAFVDMYDVSDLNNIRLLDMYQSSPGDSVIPHNTFFRGDYLFTSYYRDGLTLVDATLKNNLVEVGNYDTSPFNSDIGFEGNWGVYPYLPSGNVLISDREEGLFIVAPNYTRASYLTGVVFDTLNNVPINNAQIEILGESSIKYSQFDGSYHIGIADSMTYDIRMSHPQCQTRIATQVLLETAIEKVLNFNTACDFSTSISEIDDEQDVWVQIDDLNQKLIIHFQDLNPNTPIELFDLLGKKLLSTSSGKTKGSIEYQHKLSSGLYFVTYKQFDKPKSVGFIIN